MTSRGESGTASAAEVRALRQELDRANGEREQMQHRLDTLSSALRLALGPVPEPGRVPPQELADAMNAPRSPDPVPVPCQAHGRPVMAWVAGGTSSSAVEAWDAILTATEREPGRVAELARTDLTEAVPLVTDGGRRVVSTTADAAARKAAMRASRRLALGSGGAAGAALLARLRSAGMAARAHARAATAAALLAGGASFLALGPAHLGRGHLYPGSLAPLVSSLGNSPSGARGPASFTMPGETASGHGGVPASANGKGAATGGDSTRPGSPGGTTVRITIPGDHDPGPSVRVSVPGVPTLISLPGPSPLPSVLGRHGLTGQVGKTAGRTVHKVTGAAGKAVRRVVRPVTGIVGSLTRKLGGLGGLGL